MGKSSGALGYGGQKLGLSCPGNGAVIPGTSPTLWEPQSWTCIPKHGFFFQAFPPFPLSFWVSQLYSICRAFLQGKGEEGQRAGAPNQHPPSQRPHPDLGNWGNAWECTWFLPVTPQGVPRAEDLDQICSSREVAKPQRGSATWCWQQNPNRVFWGWKRSKMWQNLGKKYGEA